MRYFIKMNEQERERQEREAAFADFNTKAEKAINDINQFINMDINEPKENNDDLRELMPTSEEFYADMITLPETYEPSPYDGTYSEM
jgi:hypothetical protein